MSSLSLPPCSSLQMGSNLWHLPLNPLGINSKPTTRAGYCFKGLVQRVAAVSLNSIDTAIFVTDFLGVTNTISHYASWAKEFIPNIPVSPTLQHIASKCLLFYPRLKLRVVASTFYNGGQAACNFVAAGYNFFGGRRITALNYFKASMRFGTRAAFDGALLLAPEPVMKGLTWAEGFANLICPNLLRDKLQSFSKYVDEEIIGRDLRPDFIDREMQTDPTLVIPQSIGLERETDDGYVECTQKDIDNLDPNDDGYQPVGLRTRSHDNNHPAPHQAGGQAGSERGSAAR